MEPPASRKGKNGFDNPRSTRIKMRQACLKRLAVEYNQARADCCSAGAICGKEPAIQHGTGKGGVVSAEILELPAITSDGRALWAEFYPLDVLERTRKVLPPRDWSAL